MSESEKKPTDHETILMALDQISQTVEVVTSVVGRLRNYLQRQEAAAEQRRNPPAEAEADRILH